jgi:hypothetical protein
MLLINSQGMAGQLTFTPLGGLNFGVGGIFSFHAYSFQIALNNTGLPINEPFTMDGASQTLLLPAGPFVRVSVIGVALELNFGTPAFALTGDFQFEMATVSTPTPHKLFRVGAANVSATVNFGDLQGSLTAGQGALIIDSAGVAAVVRGTITVDVAHSTIPVDAAADISLKVNTTSVAVDQSVTVNGTTTLVQVPANFKGFYISNLSVSIGDYFRVSGNFMSSTGPVIDGVQQRGSLHGPGIESRRHPQARCHRCAGHRRATGRGEIQSGERTEHVCHIHCGQRQSGGVERVGHQRLADRERQ